MHDWPIGILDSGPGGLTVARALMDLLAEEDLVDLGNTGRYRNSPGLPGRELKAAEAWAWP